MKRIFGFLMVLALFSFSAKFAHASPANENKADNNPNVVAYYPSGTHGIVGEASTHWGSDLVMKSGKSGVFQQWFLGNSTESDGVHGDHSVWKPAQDGVCSEGWQKVTVPNPSWGNYFPANTDYCVHTNDYANGH